MLSIFQAGVQGNVRELTPRTAAGIASRSPQPAINGEGFTDSPSLGRSRQTVDVDSALISDSGAWMKGHPEGAEPDGHRLEGHSRECRVLSPDADFFASLESDMISFCVAQADAA